MSQYVIGRIDMVDNLPARVDGTFILNTHGPIPDAPIFDTFAAAQNYIMSLRPSSSVDKDVIIATLVTFLLSLLYLLIRPSYNPLLGASAFLPVCVLCAVLCCAVCSDPCAV
jgi:hypothetical protein